MEMRLRELLDGVQVAEPVAVNGMQVFGLRWGADPGLTYTTLDEALETGTLEVSEVDEGGSVPEIKVINKGDVMVFLMAGEQLIGAKQNRVVNASMMVPAKGELPIPVSCVEAGRWGYRSRRFRSGGSSSHSKLRRMMSKDIGDSYRKGGRPRSKQGKVWAEIDRKMGKMGSRSDSGALEQAYEDHRGRLDEILDRARVPEDCCGVAFVCDGRLAGVDLFDKPATLKKLMPKLVKAYAIDAMEEAAAGRPVEPGAVQTWLHVGMEAPSEPFESPGVGQDVRIESKEVAGACLLVDERAVHFELFPEEGTETLKGGHARIALIVDSPDLVEIMGQAVAALGDADSGMGEGLASASEAAAQIVGGAQDTDAVLDGSQEAALVSAAVAAAPDANMRIVFTYRGLEDRWFSHSHDEHKTAVVSLAQWDEISELPPAAFVAHEIVFYGLGTLSSTYEPRRLLHEDTRGCMFDFCSEKQDIDMQLRTGAICSECSRALYRSDLPVQRVDNLLDAVRRLALGR